MNVSFHFRRNRALLLVLLGLGLICVPSLTTLHAEDEDDVLESIDDGGDAEKVADAVDADADGDDESLDDLEKLVADDAKAPAKNAVNTDKAAPAAPTAAKEKSDEDTVNDMLDELAKSEPIETKQASRPVAPVAPVEKSEPRPRVTASEPANLLTNVEFREQATGTEIVLSSRGRLVFREEKNPSLKQVVYYFDQTETPQRLQRAYDTTEFASPVSLFTVFQLPGAETQSKLIVQLRDDKFPTVTASDSGLILSFPKSDVAHNPKLVVGQEDNGQAVEDNIYATGRVFSGKRLGKLELKNTEVQDAIRLVAKTSGYNIVIGDDVAGRIGTMSLENIPWDQAFTLLLQTRRLGYVRQGNVLRVATLAALTAEKNEALANEASRVRVEPLRTILIPVSYARAGDIASRGKPFLTERGTIDTDNRTNTVIIRDVQASIERVQKLITALDTQPPTVSIAGKFVEMTQNFSRNIGFRSLSFNPTLAGISFDNALDLGNPGGNLVTTIRAPDFANFQAQLHLGESDNRVKILANPTVSVIANNPATVTHGVTQFVRTTEFVNGQTNTVDRPVVANLNLTVTPIVSGDGSIFLTVNITNDVPRTTTAGSLAIDTRNVSTQVLIENGDTVVIGGVFKDQVNTVNTGVPFLNKIPIVSFLFSRSGYEGVRSELFIFLTAKVLNAEASFRRAS